MSTSFEDLMNQVESTDVSADTSFLDAYREKGSEGLAEARARRADEDLAEMESRLDEPGDDPEHDEDTGQLEEPSGQHGGAGYAGAGSAPATGGPVAAPAEEDLGEEVHREPEPEVADDAEQAAADVESEPVTASELPQGELDDEVPGSLQKTDHQEAVQAAASTATKGGSGSDPDGSSLLPSSGFQLTGSKPQIRALPKEIITVLREQLRSAATRELKVSDQEARDFSERLSQGSLVTAFLLAQLDLRMEADPTTTRAAELFRSRDPLLGSVVTRMEDLEHVGERHESVLGVLRDELRQMRQTADVIEQALAYSIADRTENLTRGGVTVDRLEVIHRSAMTARDRIREETQKRQRIERDREGRPIR